MSQQRLTESPEKTKQRIERRESCPASARSFQGGLHPILQLQRTVGNRAVGRLIQAKLAVSHPGDPYEREADRVAEQVTSMPSPESTAAAQRQLMPEEDKDTPPLQTKPLAASMTPLAQRQAMPEEEQKAELPVQMKPLAESITPFAQRQMIPEEEPEEEQPVQPKSLLQRSAGEERVEAGHGIEQQLGQSRGTGSPLPESVRSYMEPRFGTDFSGVRVHTGSESQHLNRSLNAQAFTVGQDIYYGASKPPTDLRLTAHELTHVVQQTGGGTTQRKLARGEPDIFLRQGEYNPSSGAGQELLAHELTHVVQQDGEQLQRTRTQAKEGAATGGAPSGREKGPLHFLSTTDRHEIQRQGARNVIRHRGRWGDIDSPSLLGLWAKEAAMTKLWFGSTVRALQEAPGSAPQLVDAVLPKLRTALASPEEFDGSREARQDADEALRDRWPMIREPVLEQLVARYTKQLAQALGHTPAGTELETHADEIHRVRYQPYDQFAFARYNNDMLRKGQIRGAREILDIKGCPTPKWCPVDPHTEIWFILKRDPNWIYLSNPVSDKFNWHVSGIAREVAESTQLAAELFPLLLKLAGFSLGLSSRLALIVAGEILYVLGEQGTRSARGEPMQSALEVIKSVGLNVFMAHFAGRLFGTSPTGALAADLDQATELAVVRARQEVARTDAAFVERELRAGKARAVTDAQLASDGYRLEVDVISEAQAHTWRRKTDGGWCRFSSDELCVGPLSDAVDEAARRHPPNFERDLAAAGVSARARGVLGQQKLSVNDLVARHPAAREVSTGWIDVRGAVLRGGDELPIHPASDYGLSDYIRYHMRAPGLGKESYPIPLAPTWMNHGANRIEGFMRAQRKRGFTVRFNVTRATFGGDELRPFFEGMLREGSPATLGRLANDRGRVERFLKEITYDIETYRLVGGRGQRAVWRATMVTGLPPAGTRARLELPARVR